MIPWFKDRSNWESHCDSFLEMKARGNVFSTFLIKRSNALLPLQDFNSKSNDWYKTASDWLLVQLKLIKIIVMSICIVHYDVNWYCRENSQWTDSLQRTYESFVHTDWFNHSIWLTFWTTYLIYTFYTLTWKVKRIACGLDQVWMRAVCVTHSLQWF